jgi:hypothetical protein
MKRTDALQMLKQYHHHGFSLVPLKPRSKTPLVKWKDYQLSNEDFLKFLSQGANWAIRCDEHFHALDFDNPDTYQRFIEENGQLLKDAPTVRTGRGYHVWFKPKNPVGSFTHDGIEVKGLGSLVVVPPSIHPGGAEYLFEKPLNGNLTEVDVGELTGLRGAKEAREEEPDAEKAPSDFALRYGKSPYPQALCGRATKVLTRSDGEMKHLLSLRCWKWHCPKCAPLLKRYWLKKLGNISFRFILRLPTVDKPTAFLRHVGKPGYVHIVANGESWLFLTDGDADKVWAEARQSGYELIAGDISGDPLPDEVRDCLEQALCPEEEPVNTRRKISHSRGLFKKVSENNTGNESKQKDDCSQEEDDMKAALGKEPLTWDSEVVMKPIEEIARELEREGWHIFWESEVEAVAIRDRALESADLDIVELMEKLGVRVKKTGKEYLGLCPFHDDHNPSLSVNREKGLWHCFGCGRGGDVRKFVEEWQARHGRA